MEILTSLLTGFGVGFGFMFGVVVVIYLEEYLEATDTLRPPHEKIDIGEPGELEEIQFTSDEQTADTKED
jgi:hypothetical protein